MSVDSEDAIPNEAIVKLDMDLEVSDGDQTDTQSTEILVTPIVAGTTNLPQVQDEQRVTEWIRAHYKASSHRELILKKSVRDAGYPFVSGTVGRLSPTKLLNDEMINYFLLVLCDVWKGTRSVTFMDTHLLTMMESRMLVEKQDALLREKPIPSDDFLHQAAYKSVARWNKARNLCWRHMVFPPQ